MRTRDGSIVARRLGLPVVLGLAAVLLAIPAPIRGQSARKPFAALAGLSKGHWVRLKGTADGPASVRCAEIRRLAGDFLDGDWLLKGVVGSVDSTRREFSLGPWTIQVSDRAVYDNSEGNFQGFADIRPGMYIEVEGTHVAGTVLLAAEIDDESDELAARPALGKELLVVGKVESLDLNEGRVTVMGVPFRLEPKTKIRSALE